MKKIDGHQYEYQCAKILKKSGFTNVNVTKGSGDQGIDVIAHRKGKKYGIQCKYYSSPVGNHAVQEAYAGAKYYNCDVAVVMTNTTFTKSAKDLAKKTNVLLWENSHIPFTLSSFRVTKWMGVFTCFFGVMGLISIKNITDIKLPILQIIELAFLVLGGLFNIFEHNQWGMELFASMSYILACIFQLIFVIAVKSTNFSDSILFIIFALISFARSERLHLKTNGFYFGWKRLRKPVCKNDGENLCINSKIVTNASDENALESIQNEIDACLTNMGTSYTSLFKEEFYIQSILLKARTLGDDGYEFILKLESEDHAKYLISKETVLNENLNYIHHITSLSNNIISLVVIPK